MTLRESGAPAGIWVSPVTGRCFPRAKTLVPYHREEHVCQRSEPHRAATRAAPGRREEGFLPRREEEERVAAAAARITYTDSRLNGSARDSR